MMVYVDNSQITPLYANTAPGNTADAGVVDPAIAALVTAINTNADIYTAFIGSLELPIPDQSIVTRHLRNLAVTNPKLAPLAVTADKLADGSITLAKLQDLVVTAAKIANGTITEPKYATGSVSSRAIADGAVGTSELDPNLLLPYEDIAIRADFDKRALSLSNFGVIANGVTDDRLAIQNAISYCIANNRNLIGINGATSYISGTIYLPRNATFQKQIILDFNGMTFNVSSGITVFESGELVSGSWVSSMGATIDTKNSFGVTLKGFVVNGGRYGIRVDSWNQGSKISDITTYNCETALETNNCYYLEIDNMPTGYNSTPPYTGTRFIFGGQCNLMKISGLTASNSDIGYLFSGGITGTSVSNMSFEGVRVGAKLTSYVYDVVFRDSYIEGITAGGYAFEFTGYVFSAKFENIYFNFLSTAWYAIKHTSLSTVNIHLTKSIHFESMLSDSYIFYNKEYGNATLEKATSNYSTVDDLYIEPTIYPKGSIVDHVVKMGAGENNGPLAQRVKEYAIGNYAGRYTSGFAGGLYGGVWVNNNNAVCTMDTKIIFSDTQDIYVNVKIAANVYVYIKGHFIGNVFYEYTTTGVTVSTALSISVVSGFQRIVTGTLGGTITGVDGEIRLV